MTGAGFRTAAGLLVGVIISGLEVNSLPLGGLSRRDQVSVIGPMVAAWCASAVTVSHVAYSLEPRLSPRRFAVVMALVLVGLSVAVEALMALVGGFGFGIQAFAGATPDRLGLFLHTLWMHALYGGLAVTGLALTHREQRMQAVLNHAVVAARQSKARLDAAAARELRGQIQPERLAGLIEELRARYAQDLNHGDRLLERLTDFLRAAMPSVRTGTSTLAQELETLEAYGRLMAEVDPTAAPWTIRQIGHMPDLPFPPLVLLPAVEALAADGPLDVWLHGETDGFALDLTAAGELPDEVAERLRAALRSVFGKRAALWIEDARVTITLSQPVLARTA